MFNDVTKYQKTKAVGHACMAIVPDLLNAVFPGLGVFLTFSTAYCDERFFQNKEKLSRELLARVVDLEQILESPADGALAEKIVQLVLQALQERNDDKISFFAGVIAGELLHKTWDWDEELRDEFKNTIVQVSGPELIILKAMYERKPGEALKLSRKGSAWLNSQIIINKSTIAWIDSLIRRGLVMDTSVEQIRAGSGDPGLNAIKSGSVFRLSTFGRSMIDYVIKVQAVS